MFKTIVVGNDGTEHGQRAMALAQTVAGENGARLLVVHIAELVGGKGGVYPRAIDESGVKRRLAEPDGKMQQSGLSADFITDTVQLGGPGTSSPPRLRPSEPTSSLWDHAGIRWIGQLVLGSVPLRLLHIAHCPVVIIPPAPHAA